MPQWKLHAQKYRGMDLTPRTDDTEAKTRSSEDNLQAPNTRWQLSNRNIIGVRVKLTALAEPRNPLNQQQSKTYKLVPFASLLAISGTFNSLSKVLFIFPSRYLFAIGLRSIFSFIWKLPPILRTTSKVRDSKKPHRMDQTLHVNGVLTLFDVFFQKNLRRRWP